MANPINLQQLTNASIDADTLGQVINGDENTDVTTRLGNTYPTLDKAIKIILQNGLVGSTPFKTFDDLQKSNLSNDSYAVVTNDSDTAKNGLYRKTETGFEYQAFNVQKKIAQVEQKLDDNISQIAGFTADKYALVVEDEAGNYVPILDNNGQLIGVKDGIVETAILQGMDNVKLGETLTYNNERVHFIRYDNAQKVSEVITDSGHYVAIDNQLVNILDNKQYQVPQHKTLQNFDLFGVNDSLTIDTDPNKIYMIVINGQSNAFGSSGGVYEAQPTGYPAFTLDSDPIIAGTPIEAYKNNALMLLGDAPRQYGTLVEHFIPLAEKRTDGSETMASGLVNHLIQKIYDSTGFMPTVLASVTAQGSQSYQNLKRGNLQYKNTLIAVKNACEIAKKQGKHIEVLATIYCQGEAESESDMTTEKRQKQIQQYQRDISSDLQSITKQIRPIKTYETQVATGYGTFEDVEKVFKQNIKMATLKNDSTTVISATSPMYPYPTSGNAENQIHLSNLGYNYLGQAISRAILQDQFGSGWQAFKPIENSLVWIDNTHFEMSFNVPVPPLVIDKSNNTVSSVGLEQNAGFWFDDYTQSSPTITDVSVVANNKLRFTLSKASSNKSVRLAYACRATQGVMPFGKGPYGNLYGQRGLVRDSTNHTNIYTGKPNYNWLLAFTHNFINPFN